MKRLTHIERMLREAMCSDRYRLSRELSFLKRSMGPDGSASGGLKGRLERLEAQARRSMEKRNRRQDVVPVIENYPDLPITVRKDEIISALKRHPVVIISGDTGSGKTTQIPKFCMAAGQGAAGTIGCTQPRRIAAITVASRIAQELGQDLGEAVGYKIRFDDTSSSDSIVKIMTDGILLAEAQKDPYLTEYDTLIIDEAHERSLNIDFTLGILRTLVKKRRDLKLIITSATIDTEKFSQAFGNAPVIEVSGRLFPVELRYASPGGRDEADQDDQGYVEAAAEAVDMISRESRTGDILIFMPTEQDIEETMELIRGRGYPGVLVLPLFARLPAHEQARVFSQGPGRKIIVSTNVAETSLTIPGIKYVIDSGLARIPHYSPRTRTTALPVKAISRSSADQRKGRCGRVANGICIRLYTQEDYGTRPLFTSPEILRSNLAEVILRMISLNLGDVGSFPFVDAPSPRSVRDGFDTLLELDAIGEIREGISRKKGYGLTDKGRIMAGIPLDPKLARILLEADRLGCLDEAAVIVSALSIADPRQRPQDMAQQADQKHAAFKDPSSDFITLLNIWKAYQAVQSTEKTRGGVRRFCKDNFLSFKRMREWSDIHHQIRSVLKENAITGESRMPEPVATRGLKAREYEIGGPAYQALHKSLLAGYLANIALKKEKNLYMAAKGKQAVLFPGSGISGSAGAWIIAAEYVETSQLFARTAANIHPDWIEEMGKKLCTLTWSSPHWEKSRGEVVALEQVSLFGLVIVGQRPVAYGRINPAEACEIFIRKALVEGEVPRRFPFMDHNQALIDELRGVEEKLRKRDILVTEEDIFGFYRSRLDRDFWDIRTFSRYLKDRQDDSFLRMTPADVQKGCLDPSELASYPDSLECGGSVYTLEYGFDPGADRDGITVNVPVVSAASFSVDGLDRLVPGLFKEKVAALIKNLPKRHRVRFLPIAEKAHIIASQMPKSSRNLFSELSRFIQERFNIPIPVSDWSDDGLDDYLKMRISLRDNAGREIAASRDVSVLTHIPDKTLLRSQAFDKARKVYERMDIQAWDFGDIPESIAIDETPDLSVEVFPGLADEKSGIALRLFRSRGEAGKSHCSGVCALFMKVYPKEFGALKKDVGSLLDNRGCAAFFGGRESFQNALCLCVARELFARDLRTRDSFLSHAGSTLQSLYGYCREFMALIQRLCQEYQATHDLLRSLKIKHRDRLPVMTLLVELENSLGEIVPEAFPSLYDMDRIRELPRYVAALRLRAERGALEPAKDSRKALEAAVYTAKLKELIDSLAPGASDEKIRSVETYFWMIEEFKVSLFAQELKTPLKTSSKRLDAMWRDISSMV
ncbi:MAG: ATP-dependent RNA helicase HrpA [Pseudomonadota bacterium]